MSRSFDCEPGKLGCEGRVVEGVPWHFEGNNLVAVGGVITGAVRESATFDPRFSTCTFTVAYGKPNGGVIKFTGTDGQIYEVISMSAGDFRCSIEAGNLLPN
jgi:hypothetical protein